jgi:hypothetical protein
MIIYPPVIAQHCFLYLLTWCLHSVYQYDAPADETWDVSVSKVPFAACTQMAAQHCKYMTRHGM